MSKTIKISIDQDGNAKIEAIGFKGGECKDATKVYEELYNNEVSAQDKPELYEGAGCSLETVKAG